MTSSNLIHKNGNMFTTELPAIAHGVNCKGLMGSGVAAIIRKDWPEVNEAYVAVCDKGLLHPGDNLPLTAEDGTIFLNLASQDNPGADARLDWLREAFANGLKYCEVEGIKGFAMPRIGAGIGGLNWDDVLPVIEEETAKAPNVLVEIWSL